MIETLGLQTYIPYARMILAEKCHDTKKDNTIKTKKGNAAEIRA